MKKRQLYKDGPDISCIGIGGMSFADAYGPTDEPASHAILDRAMERGVTHIDTSNVYGNGKSENAIGSYLASRGSAARDFFHIATKAGITRDADRPFDNSAEHLERELDGSLKRMGIDCVDLFYVHRREAERPIEEVTESLVGLKKAGKIRAFGFSEIAPSSLRRAAAIHPVAAVQSEYSLSTRAPELGLVQTCAELGTALVAFSPVGRGLLTDDPIPAERVPDLFFLSTMPRFLGETYKANLKISDGFRRLAAEMEVPAAGLAIAWVLSRGEHVIPIPGTRSVAHFDELLAGADVALTAEDLARIEQVLPVGWAHGDRYSDVQWRGPERFC